jgi:molybdopterin synthase catalytic subunit
VIVRVRLFAAAREAAGAGEVEVEVAGAPPRAADVLAALAARGPAALARVATRSRLAVNQELAPPERPLAPADELALIPPVGGG